MESANPVINAGYFITRLFTLLWTKVFSIHIFGRWGLLSIGGFLLGVLIVNFLCIEIYQFFHRESGGE